MTAYGMRISDWSSDVCSSDLHHAAQVAQQFARKLLRHEHLLARAQLRVGRQRAQVERQRGELVPGHVVQFARHADRKRVVEGKSVSVRVDIGGRRIIKKNKK